jgi:TonB family protein
MHPEVPPSDVFTADELASAAGVSLAAVQVLLEDGTIACVRTVGGACFIARAEAVRAGRMLLTRRSSQPPARAELFDRPTTGARTARAPFAISSLLHAGAIGTVLAATTLGLGHATRAAEPERTTDTRLVFLSIPGPGGGGGGGGLRQRLMPPAAKRKGTRSLDSPLQVRRPLPEPKPLPPVPHRAEPPAPLPPVEAPVAKSPANDRDQPGVLEQTTARNDTHGPGSDTGIGTGAGTGVGAGRGAGIGEGEGGGTGGGPYRPGSGIEPPTLLREVKPDYTEDARRRGVEGDVVMEIVVRHDGSVGDVRIVQGLGAGLDGRAVEAVRQWRFAPAHRRGAPVDVIVEVAMEFKIR